ncbi:CBS domain-containing protein [Sphingomonas sp. 3P27F8]|uniref:CBS domain-containing protein n=1 Tax=Sphingomonas sp. 3P27F8 TaxID=2502213 RepID=UPI0014853894|nr:CBS domain-containing protein [Sphingomonas sp. 3P27F8]
MILDELLKSKSDVLFSVTPETSVDQVVELMCRENIGAVVVLDGGKLAGILSEREIVHALRKHGPGLAMFEAQHIMVRNPPSASVDDRIDHVMTIMTRQKMRHVPIVRDVSIIGLLSIGDIVASRLQEMADENAVLHDIARAKLASS